MWILKMPESQIVLVCLAGNWAPSVCFFDDFYTWQPNRGWNLHTPRLRSEESMDVNKFTLRSSYVDGLVSWTWVVCLALAQRWPWYCVVVDSGVSEGQGRNDNNKSTNLKIMFCNDIDMFHSFRRFVTEKLFWGLRFWQIHLWFLMLPVPKIT